MVRQRARAKVREQHIGNAFGSKLLEGPRTRVDETRERSAEKLGELVRRRARAQADRLTGADDGIAPPWDPVNPVRVQRHGDETRPLFRR